MKKLEHDLLGEADIKTPAKKETKPAAKAAPEAPKIKMPKLGDHVLFYKAENGDVAQHLAIVMAVPQVEGSTSLSLNVLKQGYMDFVKSAPFSEEKQPHTWGFIDKK